MKISAAGEYQKEKRAPYWRSLSYLVAVSHLASDENSSRAREVKLSDVFRSATVTNTSSPSAYLNSHNWCAPLSHFASGGRKNATLNVTPVSRARIIHEIPRGDTIIKRFRKLKLHTLKLYIRDTELWSSWEDQESGKKEGEREKRSSFLRRSLVEIVIRKYLVH